MSGSAGFDCLVNTDGERSARRASRTLKNCQYPVQGVRMSREGLGVPPAGPLIKGGLRILKGRVRVNSDWVMTRPYCARKVALVTARLPH